MSKIARWSYKATARVRPFLSRNTWDGTATYGEEYSIACNWVAASEQHTDSDGREFVSRHIIYTEDLRPQYLDLIALESGNDWQEIRARTEWDMAMFSDVPDVKLVT